MPWGNPDQRSGDFVAHINLRHQFEYETFVVCRTVVAPLLYAPPLTVLTSFAQDYDRDEDAVLQEAIHESLSDF